MAKAGPPMDGRDLHIGDLSSGILPASAPLAIAIADHGGMALAFARETDQTQRARRDLVSSGRRRIAGEWHEAITCAPHGGCPRSSASRTIRRAVDAVKDQSAVRVFADKAAAMHPWDHINGTDPDEIAAAFAWAANARAPVLAALIELCHAHVRPRHQDGHLYLGKDPQPSWGVSGAARAGYAESRSLCFWSARDRSRPTGSPHAEGVIDDWELDRLKHDADKWSTRRRKR